MSRVMLILQKEVSRSLHPAGSPPCLLSHYSGGETETRRQSAGSKVRLLGGQAWDCHRGIFLPGRAPALAQVVCGPQAKPWARSRGPSPAPPVPRGSWRGLWGLRTGQAPGAPGDTGKGLSDAGWWACRCLCSVWRGPVLPLGPAEAGRATSVARQPLSALRPSTCHPGVGQEEH